MKDIKIKDAVFFPEPQTMYRELPISKVMGAEAQEYMKAWEFNGLLVFASVAEYDDGIEWLHISFSRKNRIPTRPDARAERAVEHEVYLADGHVEEEGRRERVRAAPGLRAYGAKRHQRAGDGGEHKT